MWLRLAGEFIPSFEVADELEDSGIITQREKIEARGLSGWVEHVWHNDRPITAQTALGIEAGYRYEESQRLPGAAAESTNRAADHCQAIQLSLAPRLLDMEFDDDLYDRGRDDDAQFWSERRWRAEPYAWVAVNPRLTARARVRFEQRDIEWLDDRARYRSLKTTYAVPTISARVHFGSHRQAIVEAGFASEFRNRREVRVDASVREDNLADHRLYLAYEHVFGEAKMIRVAEAIELDREDVGELRIHDHGFLQLVFGF